jgi:hypothetical protein
MPYQINTRRQSYPLRGPTSSKKLNDSNDQIVSDLHGLNNMMSAIESRMEEMFNVLYDESRFLRRRVNSIELLERSRNLINGRNGIRLFHSQTMYDISNLGFFGGDISLRPQVLPIYGLATLPNNAVEQKFFTNSIYNGEVIVPEDLVVEVTNTFIDPGSSTATNHEPGAIEIRPGEPKNAFNGVNRSYWVRTVIYPGDSDVTEVQVQLTVTLPSQNNTLSNIMVIHPYPLGSVDILEISTSPDLTSSFTQLSHKDAPTTQSSINNSRELMYVFQPQDIDQVRIKIRQRNFVLENGKKVFRYGLQELGLALMDFEKQTSRLDLNEWIGQSDVNNISFINEVKAPTNFFFTAVHYFSSDPNIELEEAGDRHVLYRIYDSDPSTSSAMELWNSNEPFPQNMSPSVGQQITLAGTVTSLFVVTSLRYVHTSGGINSPYPTNTAPYVKGFNLEYSVAPMF